MPTNQHVTAALSLIENDKSKVLGLTVGNHQNVQPGDYIPRAGKDPVPIWLIYPLTDEIHRRPDSPGAFL